MWTDGVDNHGSSVIRINPRTGAKQSIHVSFPPGAFAWSAAHGDLWINNSGGSGEYPSGFTRLHARNGASSFFYIAAHTVFPAVAGHTVWAGDWDRPQVVRLDISGSQTPRIIGLPVRQSFRRGVERRGRRRVRLGDYPTRRNAMADQSPHRPRDPHPHALPPNDGHRERHRSLGNRAGRVRRSPNGRWRTNASRFSAACLFQNRCTILLTRFPPTSRGEAWTRAESWRRGQFCGRAVP